MNEDIVEISIKKAMWSRPRANRAEAIQHGNIVEVTLFRDEVLHDIITYEYELPAHVFILLLESGSK